MKWYYIAIPVGLVMAYILFSPKSTLLKGGAGSSTPSNLGGTLTGAGKAASGLAELWGAIFGKDDDDDTDETAG